MNFPLFRATGCDDWQLTRISMNSNPVGCTISSNFLPHKKYEINANLLTLENIIRRIHFYYSPSV